MSKQTKIIAIIGGVLILAGVLYIALSPGGFGAAFEAVGCGGKAEKGKPRMAKDTASLEFNECRAQNFVCKRDKDGKVVKKKGKKCDQAAGKGAEYCQKLWAKKCADKAFLKQYANVCKKKAAAAMKEDGGDDDDDE